LTEEKKRESSAFPAEETKGKKRSKLTLSGFIDSDTVDVESLDHQAGELHEVLSDRRLPVSQTILNGRELGELTLPVGTWRKRRRRMSSPQGSCEPARN